MLLLKWLLLFHPLYVSLTEMNYNAKKGELEIAIRLFTNDLEATLKQNNPNTKVDLLNNAVVEKRVVNELVSRYLRNHFKLTTDGKPAPINYLGFENIEENTWCYFEVKGLTSLQKLHISNTILYDWKREQTNMHIIKKDGNEKSRQLVNPDSEVDFSF